MFISIDGIDGAGKTSLAVALANWFNAADNAEVIITKEPTSESPWAKELRQAALTVRLPRNVEIEYFHKDRLWHLENVIIPMLNDGKHVISDRYVDSTLAYQATSIRDADKLISRMRKEILTPNLTFILDCDVETCLQRITDRDQTITSFETNETLKLARKIFMSRKGKHYRFIDSSISVEHTFSKAVKEIIAWRKSRSSCDTSEPRKSTTSPENSTFAFV